MINNTAILLILMSMLAGCATTDSYQVPASNPALATIKGFSTRSGLYEWQDAEIQSIDNKQISFGFLQDFATYRISVTPGKHTLVVHSNFNNGFKLGSAGYEGSAQLQATFLPRQAYHLNGDVEGASIRIWVEDSNNKVISTIGKAPYRTSSREMVVTIPVIK